MAILDAIKAIQDLMTAVTGVNSAPDYPSPVVLPAVICHLGTGSITPGDPAGQRLELNNIVVELHVADGGMAEAFTKLETLHPLIIAALTADVTLTATVQTYETLTFNTGPSTWDGAPTWARIYTINNAKIIA